MNSPKRYRSGFTVTEMIVAAAVAAILSIGIMSYSASTLRMVARNVATNHSHETARGALERMLAEVHTSASRFQLISFVGTTYTDVTAAVTSDKDQYSQQYVSNRANGVRFLRLGGGPVKLTGNGTSTTVSATDTTLEFDFTGSTYVPGVGDVLQIPLVSHEYNISAAAKTTGNKWKVTLTSAVGFSFITATGTTTSGISWTNPVTVGYFYQRVGYTVLNNQLRYHPFLTDPPYPKAPASNDLPVVVRDNVTSPKPFGLLFPTSTSTVTDGSNLRISLESYDTKYSARLFQNATTTVQSIIPSRNQPPILSTN